jgi:phage tail tape-measure protein
MRRTMTVAAVLSVTLLAACGTRQPERAEGGAAAGAASGATVGLVGGPVGVAVGGAAGGVAGAVGGAATNPKVVNLGAPPWHHKRHAGRTVTRHPAD